MKTAIATLALAASASAFAPAPVSTKSATQLNDVWDSYSEFLILAKCSTCVHYLCKFNINPLLCSPSLSLNLYINNKP